MFSKPRVNVLESNQGFSVEVVGRSARRYAEEGETLSIRIEKLAFSWAAALVVYKSSTNCWEPPSTGAVMDRDKIIANLRAAFRFSGYEIEVE